MTMIFIKKNHPVIPNKVVNVFDLGYLGVEKDYPKQTIIHTSKKKEKPTKVITRRKQNITKIILKKEL